MSEVLSRAREAGVDRMFVVGFNKATIERAMKLIDVYDFLYGIIGWHPADAIDFTEEHLEWIESLAEHPNVIGCGAM
ncbi:hydrolase TatD, partial [Staphylococcus aureus]